MVITKTGNRDAVAISTVPAVSKPSTSVQLG